MDCQAREIVKYRDVSTRLWLCYYSVYQYLASYICNVVVMHPQMACKLYIWC